MRKQVLILIIFLFFGINSCYSCICSILSTISIEYQRADFVAIVKVLRNHKNTPKTNEYYKADIKVLTLYKGKMLKSIDILGSNGNSSYNSCGTFIKEGEIRLIFGSFNKDKIISTYLCTSKHIPSAAYFKRDKIIEKLNLLKKYANGYITKISNEALLYPFNFNKFYNIDSANYFSLIKVKIDTNGLIKNIEYLTKDKKELREAYELYFKKTVDWNRINRIQKNEIDGTTLFFEINPYTGSKANKF